MRILILSRSNLLYSTQRIYRSAQRAGHEVEIIDYADINVVLDSGRTRLYFDGEPLDNVDAVIGRIGPVFTPLGAALIHQFESMGTYCAPSCDGLLLARNKWRALGALNSARIPIPKSAMLSDVDQLDDIAEQLGGYPLVLKLLESTHGAGVVLASDRKAASSMLDAFDSLNQGVLVQEYIKESGGADVRAIVCGGKLVAAMTRTPAEGEFRSNLHRGGTPVAVKLTPTELDVVIRAAKAVKLDVAGVDFLRSKRGPLVMEVNASPGLEGIEGATEIDVALSIVDQVVANVKASVHG